MEVPRLRVQLELQLSASTTATAMQDPSCICNLHRSSGQILNPLSKARDRTCVLMDTSQILFHCATTGTLHVSFSMKVLSCPDICPGVGLLGHMVVLQLIFWGTHPMFSTLFVPVSTPVNSEGGFPFLHTLSSTSSFFFLRLYLFSNDFYVFHYCWLCSVNFLLYSEVTQSHIHVYILFSHIILHHAPSELTR